MMIIQRTVLILLAAGMAALPADAAAQQRRFGPSVEASVGASLGGGGLYTHRAGGAMDAVLTVPIASTSRSTVVLGVTGTANGPMAVDDICMVGPGDTCVEDYPTFMSLGVVGGVQRQLSTTLSSRLLAGPAYFQSVDGDDALGLQGRVDIARSTALPRVALVGSLRGSLLPNYEGETLRFAAVGLGLRIQ
jgi:hypothetical protein